MTQDDFDPVDPAEPEETQAPYGDDREIEAESLLDESLDESFPASDPPASQNFD